MATKIPENAVCDLDMLDYDAGPRVTEDSFQTHRVVKIPCNTTLPVKYSQNTILTFKIPSSSLYVRTKDIFIRCVVRVLDEDMEKMKKEEVFAIADGLGLTGLHRVSLSSKGREVASYGNYNYGSYILTVAKMPATYIKQVLGPTAHLTGEAYPMSPAMYFVGNDKGAARRAIFNKSQQVELFSRIYIPQFMHSRSLPTSTDLSLSIQLAESDFLLSFPNEGGPAKPLVLTLEQAELHVPLLQLTPAAQEKVERSLQAGIPARINISDHVLFNFSLGKGQRDCSTPIVSTKKARLIHVLFVSEDGFLGNEKKIPLRFEALKLLKITLSYGAQEIQRKMNFDVDTEEVAAAFMATLNALGGSGNGLIIDKLFWIKCFTIHSFDVSTSGTLGSCQEISPPEDHISWHLKFEFGKSLREHVQALIIAETEGVMRITSNFELEMEP